MNTNERIPKTIPSFIQQLLQEKMQTIKNQLNIDITEEELMENCILHGMIELDDPFALAERFQRAEDN